MSPTTIINFISVTSQNHPHPIMPSKETTTEKLQSIAHIMNSEKSDATPYKNLGFLVRVNSKEYRIRKKQCVIVLAEIEYNGEHFAYFMT
tara:strand:+ start:301 stop:570 length:270 start_codon:yes stop_codon:yes gene_type:complete